ncbi:YciI family protein [Bacillus sp. FJAT-44742]|uniref:YciI family protein n=1 Tax=Bacillus sp. FJAT-44742 TaxID=2014005 RepID=UPI000C24A4EB|nr:YciI family protein [Bacillus sp. FJAT-44742]
MKYFAAFLPMKDKELSDKYRQAHLDFLNKLKDEGTIPAYGRFVDGAGGLVIYKGESQQEVEELVKQDPFVSEGARDFEVHEWALVSDHWK